MKNKTVTVCSKCLRAVCWQGFLLCDDAYSAGTVDKTIAELKTLLLEHPSYWAKEVTELPCKGCNEAIEVCRTCTKLDGEEG